jgi:hypothetical protein
LSREDHRHYDKLLQRMREQQKQPETISKGDIALWCLAGVLGVALYLAPEKTPAWVCIGLSCMVALATHPVLNIPWVTRKYKVLRSVLGMLVIVVLVGLYGWFVWPPKPYYALTAGQHEKFMDILKGQKEPKETLIVKCPATSEELCTVATKYLEMFQRSGWKTPTGGIERGSYGKSFPGVSIAKRPQPGKLDPNDPDKGLWVLQSPSIITLRKAFDEAHIKVNWQAEQALPENTISIYFGPSPQPEH